MRTPILIQSGSIDVHSDEEFHDKGASGPYTNYLLGRYKARNGLVDVIEIVGPDLVPWLDDNPGYRQLELWKRPVPHNWLDPDVILIIRPGSEPGALLQVRGGGLVKSNPPRGRKWLNRIGGGGDNIKAYRLSDSPMIRPDENGKKFDRNVQGSKVAFIASRYSDARRLRPYPLKALGLVLAAIAAAWFGKRVLDEDRMYP